MKNDFIKHFLIILITVSFSLILLNVVNAGVYCELVQYPDSKENCIIWKLYPPGDGGIWSCGIFKLDQDCCDPESCGGAAPCCYSCTGVDSYDREIDSCESSKFIGKEFGCPNTNLYNGRICELVDDCCDGTLCIQPHCRGKYGKWDASQKQCITCDGVKQSKRIADTTQKCYDAPDYNCNWNELSCASITSVCESGCGASDECDEFSPEQQGNCPSGNLCGSDCQCTPLISTSIPANSCTDSDGGLAFTTKGTVSGYKNGQWYSYSDSCVDNYILNEKYCSWDNPNSVNQDCRDNGVRYRCSPYSNVCYLPKDRKGKLDVPETTPAVIIAAVFVIVIIFGVSRLMAKKV